MCNLEREYKCICATSGTFANDQGSCPNMAIWKIGPYVSEPKFYTGMFDLLVFKVILRSFALVSKWPVTRTQVSVEKRGVKFGSGVSCKHVYGVPLTF